MALTGGRRRGNQQVASMKNIQIDLDRIPTQALEADLDRRAVGATPIDRVGGLSSFVQKSAIICLAGILPLAAAREYAPERTEINGTAGFQDDRGVGGAGGGKAMSLSTLQDLVSGVGVILTSDFSLPRPTCTAGKSYPVSGLSR